MSMGIYITGWGAVSPAGWSASEMADAVFSKAVLPLREERRCDGAPLHTFRTVPAMTAQPPWLRHTRLRRGSPGTRFAVSAALEALGDRAADATSALGVVFVTTNGSVSFSRRFFAEVIANPSLASPILFPETVFNAPASHLGALLGSPAMNYTLVGDSAQFIAGMDLAAQWLDDGIVSECLVVAAEEIDWLSTEALALFAGGRIAAEGAAAVLLSRDESPIRIERITDSFPINSAQSRADAAMRMRDSIGDASDALLCDSRSGSAAWDKPETSAWRDHVTSLVHSPAQWLGDGFGASAGWQCAMSCELLHREIADRAIISAVGSSQQAMGAVLATAL